MSDDISNTSNSISLRPIRDEDREFLYQVYAGTRTEELSVLDWRQQQKEEFLRMQFAAQHSHYQQYYSESNFDVIEREGRLIGRLYVGSWKKEIRVIDIALLPEARGSGIGTGLMEEILAEGAATGRAVCIHVEKNNRAMNLYNRLGFVKIKDQGVYDLMEWSAPSDQPEQEA